jgi:hypothetical protein
MTTLILRRALGLVPLLLLAACGGSSKPPPAVVPMDVGGGIGSEYGNVDASLAQDEYTDADGNKCPIFITDRPLTSTTVLRIRSASCPSKDEPGTLVAVELDRKVVALAPGTQGGAQPSDSAQ